MKLLATNIQRFCLHDGPGIRTTVFLKGCSLHCPWCCNPENISFQPQYYFQRKKCIAADGICPYGKCSLADQIVTPEILKNLTAADVERCKSGAIGLYGQWYSEDELYTELMKDVLFWGKEGGVTFSGGESLLQWDALKDLLGRLKTSGTNLCVETSLFIPYEIIMNALKLIDHWIIDIKLLDKDRVSRILGGDISLYLRNLDAVAKSGRTVWLRHPQIKGYTDDEETKREIQSLLRQYPSFAYQVLEEHHLGDEKNIALGRSVEFSKDVNFNKGGKDMPSPYKYRVEEGKQKNKQKCQFTYPSKVEKNGRKIWSRLAAAMEELTSRSWNIYFSYGFEVMGPLLFGYSRWLHKAVAEQGVEHLYFLSRDGYLLMNAYKKLYPNDAISSSYLYISRKVVREAQLWMKSDLYAVSKLFPENIFLECDEFCRYFNIEDAASSQVMEDCGLSAKMCFLPKDFLKDPRLTNFYEKIKPQIIEESKKSYEKIIRYLHQNQFSGRVGIVDIGWAGTIQNCLETIFSDDITTEIIGFYLGLTQKAAKMKNRFSFIADNEEPQEFDAGFVEYPFLAPEGTLLSYTVDSEGFIIPQLANFEYDQTERAIVESMQAGALSFIQWAKDFSRDEFTWNATFSYANLKRISKHPTLREVKLFGDLAYYDGGKRQIAAPRSLAHYLFHPRDFPYDLSVSGWRIGFLKRFLKLGLDYNKMLKIYKKEHQV